jgi:cytoskeletal protein CcmA (bactofilin family)
VVGAGARFEGLFSFQGAVRLEGRLKGKVIARGLLWIGEAADVRARIEVDELIVAGAVRGEIVARERVQLLPTARVGGAIRTQRLMVAEGALFEGRLQMGEGRVASPRGSSGPRRRLGSSRDSL